MPGLEEARIDTLGGLILYVHGRVPAAGGDHVRFQNLDFEILEMEGNKIEGVRLRIATPEIPAAKSRRQRKVSEECESILVELLAGLQDAMRRCPRRSTRYNSLKALPGLLAPASSLFFGIPLLLIEHGSGDRKRPSNSKQGQTSMENEGERDQEVEEPYRVRRPRPTP